MALLLTESDVRDLLPLTDLISAMEQALSEFSSGQVTQPVRTALQVPPHRNFFGVMPAYLSSPASLGVKLVTVFNENAARGLPTHLATILLLDPETGALDVIMDGRYITEMRTAAVSAVAAKRLARTDAAVLAMLGSGVQARSHVELLARVCPFREIRAWSPTRDHLNQFVSDAAATSPVPVHAATSAQEAVRGADVIALVTSSTTPVIQDAWVSPGALVISVGACRPDTREMDPALVARARVIVDSRAAALVEAGDIVQGIREDRWTESHIAGELGEVILGRAPGRTAPDESVIFKSLGLAVEDVAAAQLVLTRAKAQGIGREIQM
ncbi:MAG TPA: ornithine cyclodeaminase family protein [Bryobacteraceae bacterium]|nr:ornithine cyclodeaminase family protein [Bryobacteraceae bacterium]